MKRACKQAAIGWIEEKEYLDIIKRQSRENLLIVENDKSTNSYYLLGYLLASDC
jgi:hypothetical protein